MKNEKDLNNVWKLYTFEDILNYGLDNGFISSSDIINASKAYEDPNKEYSDEEVQEAIQSYGLENTLVYLKNEYGLDEIIDEIGTEEIMDEIGDDRLFDHIRDSWIIEDHDNEIIEGHGEVEYDKGFNDGIKETEKMFNNLADEHPDKFHRFFCDLLGCGYYDQEGINDKLKDFNDKLNKNSYGVKYSISTHNII